MEENCIPKETTCGKASLLAGSPQTVPAGSPQTVPGESITILPPVFCCLWAGVRGGGVFLLQQLIPYPNREADSD